MPKTISATVDDWTGSLQMPQKVDHDAYHELQQAIDNERQAIYAAPGSDIAPDAVKLAVLRDLARQLLTEYQADSQPPITWSQET